ncbi:3-methyladenine DNA glycosylase [Corynebacterium lizhenjunii]|uniref:3-methyladenine DNA glycosylase n=1 Tax=Corynebacterium lizhenjunii TaxID=2709394 RepID=A0A7T0PCW6_9CORY|nr:3-methyladenine DNA glycosylase [Corynebacterium lizhenjunii]QPK80162.1 3-methyladenine DNA glycosylase [Corynebacterium lizhenjunii]
MDYLRPSHWRERQEAHEAAADDRLSRFRHPGSYHPVYDFLFEYYPVRPSHLRRWHPGFGVAVSGDAPHATYRDYRTVPGPDGPAHTVDLKALWARRGESFIFMRDLMARTIDNPATFDCFGLHEWAMVYRTDTPRHDLPLRLGAEGTNAVVESHRLKCTHYDAYRFFTPPARPLNLTVLERATQPECDQSGCVHASMDVYKWAWKLGPLVPGELFLQAFDVAVAARTLDMEASPYDCRDWGFGVVPIETPEGKAEYVRRQRELARRATSLRRELIALVDAAHTAATASP